MSNPVHGSPSTERLAALLAHATFAARFIGDNDTLSASPIAEHLDALAHGLGDLVAEQNRSDEVVSKTAVEVGRAFDDLRELVARAEALVNVADDLFCEVQPSEADAANRRRVRIRHLLGAVSDSTGAALGALADIGKILRRVGA